MGFLASKLEQLATKSSIFRGAVTRASKPIKAIDTGVGHFADAYRRTRNSDALRISSTMVKGFGQELTSRGSRGAMAISAGAAGAAGYYTGKGSKEDRLKRAAGFAFAGAGAFTGYKAFRSPSIRAGVSAGITGLRNEFNSVRKGLSSASIKPTPLSLPPVLNKPNIPTPSNIAFKNAAESKEYYRRLQRPMTTERYGPGYTAVKNRAANQRQYNDMFVNTASPAK